jgi:uncharacterized protein (UPF0305 family)
MARLKGTKKTGGRVKGTPNKVTSNLREWLGKLIDKNRLQIARDIKALDPKERLMILEKFMQYTVPKVKNIQTTIDFNQLTDEQLDDVINELTKDI